MTSTVQTVLDTLKLTPEEEHSFLTAYVATLETAIKKKVEESLFEQIDQTHDVDKARPAGL